MEVVKSWIQMHPELPRVLRKRIWRHYKDKLTTVHAIGDMAVLNDLPPSLVEDITLYILDDDVRSNPLFEGLPQHALSRLVAVLEEVTFETGEVMVSADIA